VVVQSFRGSTVILCWCRDTQVVLLYTSTGVVQDEYRSTYVV